MRTSSAVASVADGWSEQMSTSLSSMWAMSPSSLAGRWWKAADTPAGTMACTLAATDPRGGTRGWNSSPDLGQRVGHGDDDLAGQMTGD